MSKKCQQIIFGDFWGPLEDCQKETSERVKPNNILPTDRQKQMRNYPRTIYEGQQGTAAEGCRPILEAAEGRTLMKWLKKGPSEVIKFIF